MSESEHEHQVTLMNWAALNRCRLPELEMLHAIPNGGQRHVLVAQKLKAEGVRAGVPDLSLPVARNGYHGLYIELKVGKNTLTANQRDWIKRLNDAGYLAVCCHGWQEAAETIENYLEGRV